MGYRQELSCDSKSCNAACVDTFTDHGTMNKELFYAEAARKGWLFHQGKVVCKYCNPFQNVI